MTQIKPDIRDLTGLATNAAMQAGEAIMEIYRSGITVSSKEDESPLTNADRASHQIIVKALRPTGIYILSEEGDHGTYSERSGEDYLWVIDPLDGTKEFINKNGEFTVNIALIEGNCPVLGVVYAPDKGVLYAANKQDGAYKWELENGNHSIKSIAPKKLPLDPGDRLPTIVASRSHQNPDTVKFIQKMEAKNGPVEVISAGSSLKLCLVAENSADYYPRPAPTMEWDTAAGDAVCRFSGCAVVNWDTGVPLTYNKENLTNPKFLVKRTDGERI